MSENDRICKRKKDKPIINTPVRAALEQIEDKKYASSLIARGVPEKKIRKYGFAFRGQEVLIGEG